MPHAQRGQIRGSWIADDELGEIGAAGAVNLAARPSAGAPQTKERADNVRRRASRRGPSPVRARFSVALFNPEGAEHTKK
jgi:hypothetical protein